MRKPLTECRQTESQMTMKIFILLALICIVVPTATFADCKVVDNLIYVDGKPFAEFKYLKIKSLDSGDTSSGIEIYYKDTNKQIWICPKDGWRLVGAKDKSVFTDIDEINRLYNDTPNLYYLLRSHDRLSKYEFITGVCRSLKVTGSVVSVEQQGMFWNHTIKFDILQQKFLCPLDL